MALSFRFSSKGLPCVRNAATILQLLSALTFINARLALVSSTQTPDMTIDSAINENYANAVNSLTNNGMEKRTWQQLQNAWGKRAPANNNGWNVEATDDDAILAERWIPVLTAGGGPLSGDHPEILKYSMVYLTNAAALERLANRHQADTYHTNEDNDTGYKFDDDIFAPSDLNDNDNLSSEKRNWKSMNAAWGKRRNAPAWNKFRGSSDEGVWGKREPGWNNLKGMWGKRSSKDWQKLHTGWGKRAQNPDEIN